MKLVPPTKYLQLPFVFDQEKLVKDLRQLLLSDWIPHFNQGGYTGEWNSLPLYAPGGNPDNILANGEGIEKVIATPILGQCEYFQQVIAYFLCPFSSIRLLRLAPAAHIKPHRDYQSGYEDNFFRLHIPILTNSEVNFRLDGQRLNMQPGECWYTNVNYVHSVSNDGTSDRVHLVIDGQRNDWSDELFFSLAPKESFLQKEEQEYDPATIRMMIEELKRQEGEGAKALIKELSNFPKKSV
ncbi:MAG: aspartyl/asparaginyl beta-hydroxylase domain-containing protein [Saprospiraceae bacterium]|nr:aspartyl/asparaginyl beta-hydroxylase domain-containing protein [Saprospiraceae bacterium]